MVDLLNPGVSGWCAILPKRTAKPALEQDIEADLLVIGGGFAGLAAATRAKQLNPDLNVVIVDSVAISESNAGRNSGFMIDIPHHLDSSDYAGQIELDQQKTRLNRGAIDFCESVVKTFGLPAECFSRSGKINAAATKKGHQHNVDFSAHLSNMGEDFTLLDKADMQAITGVDYYYGGLRAPGTALIQPALLVRSWADALVEQRHVQLYEKTPIQTLEKSANHWRAKTAKGTITAKQVILAVNGLIERFGYYQRRVMHIYTYATMTSALTEAQSKALGGQPEWGLTPSNPMGTTVRKIQTNVGQRIAMRNRYVYHPTANVNVRKFQRRLAEQRRLFDQRFPMLADVKLEHQWAGRLCLDLNDVGIVGEIEPGLYSACCQNGLGTTKGIVAGIIASEQALVAGDTLLPDYQSEPKPKKLYPEPLMDIGANAFLRFKGYQAGREV